MKKRFIAWLILLVGLFALCACSSADGDFLAPEGGASGDISGDASEPSGDGDGQYGEQAGVLTGAEWNDLKEYAFWNYLFSQQTGSEGSNGAFAALPQKFDTHTLHRIAVQVADAQGQLLSNVKVEALDADDSVLFTAISDRKGNAYLFPADVAQRPPVKVRAYTEAASTQKEIVYESGMETVELTLDTAQSRKNEIELLFMVDTTGSMGDELTFLKNELKSVVNRIELDNPGVVIRLALVFYRDLSDSYITLPFDFTTDIDAQKAQIDKQSANGGGDWPEAVDLALERSVGMQWSSGDVTRILFAVLDAPPHDQEENLQRFEQAVLKAAEMGIRIVPVMASSPGSSNTENAFFEYLMRSAAMRTGGTFTFLTDDSGVGDTHIQPTVGNYTVEYLNSMLVRIVNSYHTGTDIAPVYYKLDSQYQK